MKRVVIMFLCIFLLPYSGVCEAKTTAKKEQKILDIICEPDYSGAYGHLQRKINEYHLPGYCVKGKKIYQYYTAFDWFGTGKNTVESAIDYVPSTKFGYLIFDEAQCYMVKMADNEYHYLAMTLSENFSDPWKAILTLFDGTTSIEICGESKTVETVTCFETGWRSIIVYITTADGSTYVRHYDENYEGLYQDYLLEDFVAYVDRYAHWLELKYPGILLYEGLASKNPFAQYMNDGAPASPAPMQQIPIEEETNVIWYILMDTGIVLAGMIVVAGGITVIVLVRRRKKRKTKI